MKNTLLVLFVCVVVLGGFLAFRPDSEKNEEYHTSIPVDHPAIIDFFRSPSTGMCDENNIRNTPTRTAFCTDIAVFTESIRITNQLPSPTGTAIAFSIETDELSPDTALGMFFPKKSTDSVVVFTNFYLGNAFLGFSPSGEYFAYTERCWEAVCGFTIKDTATLRTLHEFGNAETGPRMQFSRWIDEKNFEYTVGDVAKVFPL